MEHVFDSEESTSSGCESGWTLYLQHSIPHDDHFSCSHHVHENDQEDDDNMSMVSDASSGPPHFHQPHDEDDNNNHNGYHPTLPLGCRKRRKIHSHFQDLPASVDDTASSPFFTFSNKDLKVCHKEASIEDDGSFDYSQAGPFHNLFLDGLKWSTSQASS